ncbi:ribulose-1,5 bisphosphate carboxylase/oxygenase large subunit N-methyltransferase, chloroplastic isoform X2 [Primulina tabacum]|uniref:ribulose-1,5 bisphosphate carboxylase/oxygenase large subunit N-methyltransferase, chloroplastic isoform X2 n=1 Tax=Primulina tabacum TaxID=48773 RepID=UPI003F5940B8
MAFPTCKYNDVKFICKTAMILHCAPITNTSWIPTPLPVLSILFRNFTTPTHYFTPLSPSKASLCVDDECNDFLPWLERKAGREISSLLAIGTSSFGRSLYASDYIRAGDCILKVPYSVQMAPDNLPPEISCLLGDKVGNVAKVALLILLEQKLARNSEWAPYVSRLPKAEKMHSTVFWSNDELEMIQPSALYRETLKQKTQIGKDFTAIKATFDGFHYGVQDITLQEFAYAYGLGHHWYKTLGFGPWFRTCLVRERVTCDLDSIGFCSKLPQSASSPCHHCNYISCMGKLKGCILDFLNHDGTSEAYVLSDELKQHSEVLADRDYAPGDQILIRYGRFSNATLLLDFGFTVPHNIYDQVLVEFSIPHDDQFNAWKLGLLERYRVQNTKEINDFTSDGNIFRIKLVRAGSKKGKGIPQALRAFGRVMSSNSRQEINAMVKEAAQNDGRLARYPLENRIREIEAHQFLLVKMAQLIEEHKAHIKLLEPTPPYPQENSVRRRKFAKDLLGGELRVLTSASAWLKNYCLTLSGQ